MGKSYENRGIAQVQKLGNRWVLNVMCGATHSTYLDDTSLDLDRFSRGYVTARYHYVDRSVSDPKCVRAPCGPIEERRVVLERLKRVSVSPSRANDIARRCKAGR